MESLAMIVLSTIGDDSFSYDCCIVEENNIKISSCGGTCVSDYCE